MQLGTRWNVGATAPTGLPEIVLTAIADVESDLGEGEVDVASWRWQLTWLEGRPVVELDDGTTITYKPDEDAAYITQPQGRVDDDDDWGE